MRIEATVVSHIDCTQIETENSKGNKSNDAVKAANQLAATSSKTAATLRDRPPNPSRGNGRVYQGREAFTSLPPKVLTVQ